MVDTMELLSMPFGLMPYLYKSHVFERTPPNAVRLLARMQKYCIEQGNTARIE